MTKIVVGFRIPKALLKNMDDAVELHNYESRTALVLESVRDKLAKLRKEVK